MKWINYSGETYKKLTTYLSEHPEETNQLVQLLFVNRYLEEQQTILQISLKVQRI